MPPAGFLVNQCGAKLPQRLTPLKTKPAVDIPRGSEVSSHLSVGSGRSWALGSAASLGLKSAMCFAICLFG
jgi:hypothetical protein